MEQRRESSKADLKTEIRRIRRRVFKIPGIRLKAGAVIEAAVIVPLTLIILAAVVTVVFVLHDRVILNTVSLYEVMEEAGEGADAQTLQDSVSEMLSRRLITAKDTGVSADPSEDGILVEAGGSIQIPLRIIRYLMGSGYDRIDTDVRVTNLNGRKQLIRYKTICDGLEALTQKDEE